MPRIVQPARAISTLFPARSPCHGVGFMITSYAPGRAELLGNHTDYNEGLVLSIGVDRGITLTGTTRADHQVVLAATDPPDTLTTSLDEIAPSSAHSWANYLLGVIHEFQQRGASGPGFELAVGSTLPAGAGLSSSAALECATARFLQRIWNTQFDDLTLARMGQAAEHHFVGVRCGLLDQLSSLFARDGHVLRTDFRTLEVTPVPLPPGLSFVVAQSGVKHALVAGEYNERRQSCEGAARALGVPALRDIDPATLESRAGELTPVQLKRARHIVGENDRVARAAAALASGDAETLGRLMFESHESSRVQFENSCVELDTLVDAARSAPGCLGARLSGGGFGGATINLVRTPDVPAFHAQVVAAFTARHGHAPELLDTRAAGSEFPG
jgi:galactokinase